MEEAFLALIRGDTAVSAVLSKRINWVRRPQSENSYPACRLQRVSGSPKYNMKTPDGLSQSRVQLDIWAETYAASKQAQRSIVAVLSGYRGMVSGIRFQGIFIENIRDLADEEIDSNKRLFRVSFDALIWHTE